MITSADLYPLAQRLHGLIPERLRRWTGVPADPADRDRLAEALLWACEDVMHGPQAAVESQAPPQPDDERLHAYIISEALAGFVTQWGCRYGTLDDDVDGAQAALVTALGGVVHEPGVYQLREGTPITVAAIAHLIGWVCILEVPEEAWRVGRERLAEGFEPRPEGEDPSCDEG